MGTLRTELLDPVSARLLHVAGVHDECEGVDGLLVEEERHLRGTHGRRQPMGAFGRTNANATRSQR